MNVAKFEDLKSEKFLEIIDDDNDLIQLADQTIRTQTSKSSTTTKTLAKNLKNENEVVRIEIVALSTKLLFQELSDLPKSIKSTSPIPATLKKRGRTNLNYRKARKKIKVADKKSEKSESILDRINVKALRMYKTTVPHNQIVSSPDIVSFLKFLLHLHSILVLNDLQKYRKEYKN